MLKKMIIPVALILFLLSCGDKKPTELNDNLSNEVLGKYSTSTFSLTTDNNSPIDVLSAGGYINMELIKDGTTNGELFIPDTLGLTEGGSMKFELLGQFTLMEDKVTFEQDADTFIRNVEWVYSDSKLSGNYNKSGVLIEVVLSKN